MSNPVMNSPRFQQQMGGEQQPGWYGQGRQDQQGAYGQPYQDQYAATQYARQQGRDRQLEDMYAAPAAGAGDTGRMTYNDIIAKTGMCLVLVVVGAVAGWVMPGIGLIGAVVGLVLGLVNSFKREPSAPLILAYAVAEGLFLGALSIMMEVQFPGIVLQAVLATLSVFAVVLALYSSGKFRPTPKMTKIFMIAMLGYFVFTLVNLVVSLLGVTDGMFGLRSGPLGLVIGAVAVLLAAFSLVMDFSLAEQGVRNGAPQKYSWTVAFGLTVTLIWLYTEILRIVAILRSDD